MLYRVADNPVYLLRHAIIYISKTNPKGLNVYKYNLKKDKNGDKSDFDKWENDCAGSESG